MTSLADDPAVRAIAKALYGDAVSAEEFAKSIDPSDAHIDQPVGGQPPKAGKKKAVLAGALVAGAGIEALAAGHTIKPLVAGINEAKPALAGAEGIGNKIRTLKPLVAGPPKKVITGEAAPATNAALQVGNFGVGLGAAKELAGPKKPKPGDQVGKALRVRLRPVNAGAVRRTPSLRARRPAGSPAVSKGVVRNVKTVTANAAKASDEAAVAAKKVRVLIPTRKAAVAGGAAGIAGLGAANGAATYVGAKRGTKAALGKSFDVDGEISKVDLDQRQVFGWANVSVKDGVAVLDRQGDEIPIEELEKAAYDYILDSRIGGDQHERITKADMGPRHTSDVIESMVFTPEKIAALGLPSDFPQGWWLGMQVNDEPTWQLIKSGKRTGFSVHGSGRRTPIEKSDRPRKVARHADVRERFSQAAHPPAVRRTPTPESSALSSVGYQPQTRKLDVEMRSRPGQPYSYRVKPKTARKVLDAPSKGRAYTSEVRNRAPHHTRYTPADRARLFAHPQRESA